MKRSIHFIACVLFLSLTTAAQELDCEIALDVTSFSLPAEARDNLIDFANQVKQYMNSHRWTKDGIEGDEKIKCRIDITILGSPTDNHYSAKAQIGSQRPIFKSERSTAVTRIVDDKWDFQYIRNQSLTHDENRFEPLLSFLDFYAYIILGYDFDTYKSGDGTQYFQKALEIVNPARGAANAGKGWEPSTRGQYSRAQLIDELLNPKYRDLREAVYRYHYRGLDLLYKDQEKARKTILSALEKIRKLQEKINESSVLVRLFFDTKYLEIAETFVNDPDLSVFTKLIKIDPSHQKNYEEKRDMRR